jgi:hypothetical protein
VYALEMLAQVPAVERAVPRMKEAKNGEKEKGLYPTNHRSRLSLTPTSLMVVTELEITMCWVWGSIVCDVDEPKEMAFRIFQGPSEEVIAQRVMQVLKEPLVTRCECY